MVMYSRKLYNASRIIYAMHNNGVMPKAVDHINGDRTDDRIENLRAATRSQNAWNVGLTSRNKSGVKGVDWYGAYKKWRARICINREVHNLGYFDSIKDAERALLKARKIFHGEFARHA